LIQNKQVITTNMLGSARAGSNNGILAYIIYKKN